MIIKNPLKHLVYKEIQLVLSRHWGACFRAGLKKQQLPWNTWKNQIARGWGGEGRLLTDTDAFRLCDQINSGVFSDARLFRNERGYQGMYHFEKKHGYGGVYISPLLSVGITY